MGCQQNPQFVHIGGSGSYPIGKDRRVGDPSCCLTMKRAWPLLHRGFDIGDIGSGHLTVGHHLTFLDLPQPEGAGDIAILVE